MNVHYLVERVMGGDTGRPLRWDDVIASPVPLKVVATSLDTLTTVILDDFKDVDDLKKCLLAARASRAAERAGDAQRASTRGRRRARARARARGRHGRLHARLGLAHGAAQGGHGDGGDERRRKSSIFGRIRDRLSRIRRERSRDVAAAASTPDAEKRSSENPNRSLDEGDGAPKPAQSALYRAIATFSCAPRTWAPSGISTTPSPPPSILATVGASATSSHPPPPIPPSTRSKSPPSPPTVPRPKPCPVSASTPPSSRARAEGRARLSRRPRPRPRRRRRHRRPQLRSIESRGLHARPVRVSASRARARAPTP